MANTVQLQAEIFERLFARRVPQTFAAYGVACWGGIQFVDWLTGHYQLSSYLVDFFVAAVLLALPSVGILAYFRGEPGPTPWSKVEKFGIPLNLVVMASVLFGNFQGKELGAMNEMVIMKDRNGAMVERAIPKTMFRKRIAMFFFENTDRVRSLDWLRQGLPNLLSTDLSQDLNLEVRDGYDMAERVQKATFSYRDALGLGLERDIANYYRLNYLVRGKFTKVKDRYQITISLYETKLVKRLTQHVYEGSDLLELIDQMSVQLKRDVGLPDSYADQMIDMPVAEISSQSFDALAALTQAFNLIKYDQNYAAARPEIIKAVNADPTYAMAHFLKFIVDFNSGQIDQANQDIQQTRRYIFKLTERYQFIVNSNYYFAKGQSSEQFNVLQQWAKVYPEDTQAHGRLVRYYEGSNQYQQAILTSEKILKLDPEQYPYLAKIGDLLTAQGRYEEAQIRYQEYINRLPDQPVGYLSLAKLYMLQGDFTLTRSALTQALSRDPDNIDTQLHLAMLEMYLGNWNKARIFLQSAQKTSKLPNDVTATYSLWDMYYRLRGEWRASVEQLPSFLAATAKSNAPITAQIYQSALIGSYAKAGMKEQAFRILKEREKSTKGNPLLNTFVQLGYLKLYLTLEDPEPAQPLVTKIRQVSKQYGLQNLSNEVRLTADQGQIAELKQDYAAAIRLYNQQLIETPNERELHIALGRVYRKQKNWSQALSELQQAIKLLPSHGEAHYELAQVYDAQGNRSQALVEVNKALDTWAEADATDPLVAGAKQLKAQL